MALLDICQPPAFSPTINLIKHVPYPSSDEQKPKPHWRSPVDKCDSAMPIPNKEHNSGCNPNSELAQTRPAGLGPK